MLILHRSTRSDFLVQELATLLASPLDDPFAPDVVAVPTRGVERWLAQRVAERLGISAGRTDGICANVEFPSVSGLVADAVATACGIGPDTDPWAPERAIWPLLDVVDESLGEPWMAVLTAHLGADDEQGADRRRARRLAAVRHLARLFDGYGRYRPAILRGWAAGEDAELWQAELWRRLRGRLDVPSPAERLAEACVRLREDAALLELPRRLSLFGLTRMPGGRLEAVRALAAHRDVHLFLLHPSPALWQRVAMATDGCPAIGPRRGDPTAALARNRLLASWGDDARELQLVVTAGGDPRDVTRPSEDARPNTLLHRLQADIRADAEPPGPPLLGAADERAVFDLADRSVQVHACHGRARQVEVVREAILHELAADPTLEPRDVIVMCPDIETFAPLVHATFGAAHDMPAGQDGSLRRDRPDLRVRLADRSLRQTNPVLGVVAQLLDIAHSRVTSSQVLDLADRAPVRRRFRLDDDDLTRLEDWVAATGIRWGLDAAHRAPFKLDALPGGTWRAGLDRLLVGVTLGEEDGRLFAGVLPLDDVESGAIDLVGRFCELVDRLQTILDELSGPRDLAGWASALAHAADALTDTAPQDAWQRNELSWLLADVVAEASAAATPESIVLTLAEVRGLLAERLQGRPTRANFCTGHLTVCTLEPMRSVPHRVICLLGLDDGVFPRKERRDGDDLLLDDPHVGDRSPRSEDRQLLLDALMAAGERLIITYSGNDERNNAVLPPAVPVGELLDTVDRTAHVHEGAVSERVVTRHPLQPFDPRNFEPGALLPDRSWGFDQGAADGARALRAPRTAPPPFLAGPLAPAARELVGLEELVRFLGAPVRAFLRQRLGISVGEYDDDLADDLPVQLDGLEVWGVGERLLAARLAGTDLRTAAQAEIARGTLPPGNLGMSVLAGVRPIVDAIVARAEEVLDGDAKTGSVDLQLVLPGGQRLTGTVPGICGDVLRAVSYSRVGPRHRLAAWVQWLALTAAQPERRWQAVTVGRVRQGGDGQVTVARLPALDLDAPARRAFALDRLAVIVDLHARGMREPLPLACVTSAAYAEAAAAGSQPARAAARAWESAWSFDKEDRAPEHQLVFGGVIPWEVLMAEAPRDDEAGDGWHDADTTRFGRYARRLWHPLLAHEQVADR